MGIGISVLTLPGRAAEFEWRAPPGCPEAIDVQAKVEEALGVELSEAAPVRIVAIVEDLPKGSFELRLSIDGQLRVIRATSCHEVGKAAAVAIALALDAQGSSQPNRSDSIPEPPAEEVEAAVRDDRRVEPAAEPRPTARASAGLTLSVGAGGVLDTGSLPSVAPGVEVGVRAFVGTFGAQLGAVGFPERGALVDGSTGGEFALVAGALGFCARTVETGFSVSACLGSELGQMRGRGVGVSRPRDGTSLWVMPRSSLGLDLPFGTRSLNGWARFDAGIPLFRDQFTLGGVGVVHQPGSVVFRFGAGLALDL